MRLFFLISLIAIFCTLSVSAQTADCDVRVTLLHVNDVYQFMPVDDGKRGGLARLLTIRKETQAKSPNLLFFMGGDTISPSVESNTYKGKQMIEAWNAVGIDYAVFGNHEFDFGVDILKERMRESKFGWLGANVIDTKTKKIFADTPPFVIREFEGVKIGILGLVLPETKITSKGGDKVDFANSCDTAKKIVPEMRKKGANVIIGLTHLSMGEDKELAKCANFDLILGGHEHTLLQSSSNGTPIFKMTADAREVGRFQLFINRTTGKLDSLDWEIIPVNESIAEDPSFSVVTDKYKDLLLSLAEPVGFTTELLDARSLMSRTRETNVGNFIADAFRAATNSDVAFLNGGSIRADLTYNKGSLSKRDLLSILPYSNPVVKVEVSGKTLRAALEHGVARSAEDKEPGRFPQVSGLKFTFDTSLLSGKRVTEIIVSGKPLDDAKTYTVASTSFTIIDGGDGYDMFKTAKILIDATDAQKSVDIFRNAVANSPNQTIAPKIEGRITRIDGVKIETKPNCPPISKKKK